MAVKDRLLYVGGLGKEWTTTIGEFRNYNPMWTKIVTHGGYIRHVNWMDVYKKLRNAAGIYYPGYMIHEAAQWSDIHRKWFFLPRRASKDIYTEKTDERMGSNYMVIADENFERIEVRQIGNLVLTRGFSAFQFIPGTQDNLILALKSEEDAGTIKSYVMVFDISGKFLLEETELEGNYKFEGIEFI